MVERDKYFLVFLSYHQMKEDHLSLSNSRNDIDLVLVLKNDLCAIQIEES